MKKLIAFWAVVIFVGASLLYGSSSTQSHGTAQRYALGVMHAVAGSASDAMRFLHQHL